MLESPMDEMSFADLDSQLGQSPPIDTPDYILPQYSTALFQQAQVPVKFEFSSPYTSATHRAWITCLVTLNSTSLELKPIDEPFMVLKPTVTQQQQRLVILPNELPRPRSRSISLKPSISSFRHKHDNNTPDPYRPPPVPPASMTFTLQYAVCGHAADYAKRPNCLRVRAESVQFLIQFDTPQECIEWANGVQSGIDLALPLEHRQLPKVRSLPRRRRNNRFGGMNLQISQEQRQRAYSTVESAIEPGSAETRSRSKSTSSIAAFRLFANLRRPRRGSEANARLSEVVTRSRGNSTSSLSNEIFPLETSQSNCDSLSMHSTDSFASDMDSAASSSSATTISQSSQENVYKERWDPEVEQMTELAELKYATRCLKRFQRHSSWINKITMCDNKPYLVKDGLVQLVANENLVSED